QLSADRQLDGEGGACAYPALHLDGAFVRYDDTPADRQSQTDSSRCPRARRVHSIESLEEVRDMHGIDPLAGIAHRQHGVSVRRSGVTRISESGPLNFTAFVSRLSRTCKILSADRQ